MAILSTILYIVKQKKLKKNMPSIDWKLRLHFFYIYLQSSATELSNRLIALDLLMLWIIQR